MNPQRFALTYHAITGTRTHYSYDTSIEDLRAQLRIIANAPFPIEVTFDDGDKSHATLAASALEEYGLRGIFFVTLGWTGNDSAYMGWEDLNTLCASGHTIGLHGWSHKLLSSCSKDELEEEIARPRKVAMERLGGNIETISMPGGRWNARVLRHCVASGYRRIYTSDAHRSPFRFQDSEIIGRLNMTSRISSDRLLSALVQSRGLRAQTIGLAKTALQRGLGDRLYHHLWSLINGYERQGASR